MKHKSPDYKLSAVKYYLNNKDGYDKTCKIFDCKKSSIKRWIHTYNTTKTLTRKNRNPVSYKINKEQVRTALNTIDKNEQITMDELMIDMKQKYNNLDITSQHLGSIDLIFIDGNHTYKYVLEDLENYYPKLNKNGIICGDDFFMRTHENDLLNTMLGNEGYDEPMVYEAVIEFCKRHSKSLTEFGKHRGYGKTFMIIN